MAGGTRFSVEFSGESYMVFLAFSLSCFIEWRSLGYSLKGLVLLHKLFVKVV